MRGHHVKNKRDANEAEIVSRLRAHGLSVYPIDKPCDLIVGYRGRTYLVEVKSDKGRLTRTQQEFVASWRGCWAVLRSVDEASDFALRVRLLDVDRKKEPGHDRLDLSGDMP